MITVKDLNEKLIKLDYDCTSLNDEEMELYERLQQLNSHIGKLGRHFKGKCYLIMDRVMHTETGEDLVIYKAMYGDYKKFARPIDMFLSRVDTEKYPEATQKYRMEFIHLKLTN